jgi:hypothetical protein
LLSGKKSALPAKGSTSSIMPFSIISVTIHSSEQILVSNCAGAMLSGGDIVVSTRGMVLVLMKLMV